MQWHKDNSKQDHTDQVKLSNSPNIKKKNCCHLFCHGRIGIESNLKKNQEINTKLPFLVTRQVKLSFRIFRVVKESVSPE